MAQASQCTQFLPSKDEEQSRAMYGLKATWALNNNKTQVKLSSKQQISSQQCTAAQCKKVLSSWAVIRLSSAAD